MTRVSKPWLRQGYWFVHIIGHPHLPDGDVAVHRMNMTDKMDRRLETDEIVHHVDGNPLNNDLDNLEIMSRSGHASHHLLGKAKSPAQLAKMSANMRGKKLHLGHLHSAASKRKMRMAKLMRKGATDKQRASSSINGKRNTGRVIGAEGRRNMSLGQKGKRPGVNRRLIRRAKELEQWFWEQGCLFH